MTPTYQLVLPAEILLWLCVVGVLLGLVALPFVLWWSVRLRRQYVEDFERRQAETEEWIAERVRSIEGGPRRPAKRFKLHDGGDAA